MKSIDADEIVQALGTISEAVAELQARGEEIERLRRAQEDIVDHIRNLYSAIDTAEIDVIYRAIRGLHEHVEASRLNREDT